MCYSQTDPVIESSSNITFYCPTYTYPELFSHMRSAKISLWTNKWTDIYDFTPEKRADDGTPNYTISTLTKQNFVITFSEMKKMFERASKEKGEETNDMRDIVNDDDDNLLEDLVYEDAEERKQSNLGDYFNQFASNMLRTTPP